MIEVKNNIPLSEKTFYGIGGPADEFYELSSTEGLGELWAETVAQNIPKIVIKGPRGVFRLGCQLSAFVRIHRVLPHAGTPHHHCQYEHQRKSAYQTPGLSHNSHSQTSFFVVLG